MGLLYGHAEYVATVCRDHHIAGKAVTLGKVDVFISYDQYTTMFAGLGLGTVIGGRFCLNDPLIDARIQALVEAGGHLSKIPQNPQICAFQPISDELFFGSLGFTSIVSIDVNDYQGASVAFDLNDRDIESTVTDRFDLVLDCGVMEHVFDVAQVLRNTTKIAAVGGLIVHIMPGNNFYDHGFYQISPMLFDDFYRENKFEIADLSVMEYSMNQYAHPINDPIIDKWDRYRRWRYDYDLMRVYSFGQLTNSLYYTVCSARKTSDSTTDRVPRQRGF